MLQTEDVLSTLLIGKINKQNTSAAISLYIIALTCGDNFKNLELLRSSIASRDRREVAR